MKPFVLYFQPDVNKLDGKFINSQILLKLFVLSKSIYYATLSRDTELLDAKFGMYRLFARYLLKFNHLTEDFEEYQDF
jgi:hypothetical protein